MKVSTLRKIDSWVGTGLTVFLSVVGKTIGGRRQPASGTVRKMLFVKLAEQGSTVLAYGAIRREIRMVGGAYISWF